MSIILQRDNTAQSQKLTEWQRVHPVVVGEEGGFGLLKEDLLYKEVIPNLFVCVHEMPFSLVPF